jgi:hypothetical protein
MGIVAAGKIANKTTQALYVLVIWWKRQQPLQLSTLGNGDRRSKSILCSNLHSMTKEKG